MATQYSDAPFRIARTDLSTTTYVVMGGEVDIAAVDELERALTGLSTGASLSLDMRGVTFLDCPALAVLARTAEATLTSMRPSAACMRLLRITGLSERFTLPRLVAAR